MNKKGLLFLCCFVIGCSTEPKHEETYTGTVISLSKDFRLSFIKDENSRHALFFIDDEMTLLIDDKKVTRTELFLWYSQKINRKVKITYKTIQHKVFWISFKGEI